MKKLFLAALVASFMVSPSWAGTVDLSIPTTAAQDAKLARLLVLVNEQRVREGLDPFADFNAYAEYVLIEAVKGYLKEIDRQDKTDVAEAYDSASAALKAQIRAALGLQ